MSQPAPPASPPQVPQKPQGSTKGRGRGKPREIKGFTKEDLKIKRPKTVEERVKYRRKREERSPIQQAVDTLILEAYKDWRKAGEPRKFVDMPIVVWEISKNKEDDARFMLGKAAQLIQRQLRYGDCPETDDGKSVELSFYVLDRLVKVEGAPDENESENGESSSG
jgi:hypothetical protein